MRNHTPNDICNITPKFSEAHRAVRPARIQFKAGLVDTNFERLEAVDEDHIPVLAEDSAIDPPTSSRPENGREAPTPSSFHHKENTAGNPTSGSRKRISPEQLERRRERRRRAQQIKRMMKSDKRGEEPTPRVSMQWEKSEVQRLLYKQELALKSAHQAELQKQELRLKSAHQAELQKQELRLKSAHQVKQSTTSRRGNQHETKVKRILRYTCRITAGNMLSSSQPTCRLRLALQMLDDSLFLALDNLRKGTLLDTHLYEDIHCE